MHHFELPSFPYKISTVSSKTFTNVTGFSFRSKAYILIQVFIMFLEHLWSNIIRENKGKGIKIDT